MVTGLMICFVLAVALFAVLRFSLFPYLQSLRTSARLLRDGMEAHAILLQIKHTGRYVNDLPLVSIQMKVQPYMGRNFVAETKQVVSPMELSHLRTGSFIKVKYNPYNQKEIMVMRNW